MPARPALGLPQPNARVVIWDTTWTLPRASAYLSVKSMNTWTPHRTFAFRAVLTAKNAVALTHHAQYAAQDTTKIKMYANLAMNLAPTVKDRHLMTVHHVTFDSNSKW